VGFSKGRYLKERVFGKAEAEKSELGSQGKARQGKARQREGRVGRKQPTNDTNNDPNQNQNQYH